MLSIREATPAEFAAILRFTANSTVANANFTADQVGAMPLGTTTPAVPDDSLAGWHLLIAFTKEPLDEIAWHQLAQLKNMFNGIICVMPEAPIPVTESSWIPALRSLGFNLLRQADEWAMCYDIASYKAVPDWLNPRHWAHPERWNKARW